MQSGCEDRGVRLLHPFATGPGTQLPQKPKLAIRLFATQDRSFRVPGLKRGEERLMKGGSWISSLAQHRSECLV